MAKKRGSVARPSQAQGTSRGTALLVTAIYALIIATIAWHHELWRDEVRALNIAAGARSLPDLFALLHNEGHPPLWHLLLYSGYRVTHSMLILKPITLLCAIGAAYVFVRRAPFPLWQKVLFLCGAFPLYQYAVLCRGHALAMLLLFGVAAGYKTRFTRPLAIAGLLVLLANVNAYALILAVAVLIAILGEALIVRPAMDRPRIVQAAWGLTLVLAGIILSILVMLPDSTTTVSSIHARSVSDILRAVASSFSAPGSLYAFLAGGHAWLASAVFWVITATFLSRPWLLLAWLAAGVAFSSFSSLVYESDFMQRGLLYMFFVALSWVATTSPELPLFAERYSTLTKSMARARQAVLVVLLVVQIPASVAMTSRDISAALSSSERLGQYLTSSRELQDAVVIAEPAVMVEALPYYAPNRIFLPREGKDLIKVSFTTASKRTLSLDEFLATAEKLRTETGRPVVMVVHHQLSPDGPFVINYPYGLEFDYSIESLQRFQSSVIPLAVFDKAVSDENYALFRLR